MQAVIKREAKKWKKKERRVFWHRTKMTISMKLHNRIMKWAKKLRCNKAEQNKCEKRNAAKGKSDIYNK